MFRIYIIGVCILLTAIIANVVIGKISICSWYEFGPRFFRKGLVTILEVGLLNSIWLFVLYPLILACGYLIGDKIYNSF